jgi:hypothetical protein
MMRTVHDPEFPEYAAAVGAFIPQNSGPLAVAFVALSVLPSVVAGVYGDPGPT